MSLVSTILFKKKKKQEQIYKLHSLYNNLIVIQ